MYKAKPFIGKFIAVFFSLAVLLSTTVAQAKVNISANKGDKLYTKFALYHEENVHLTTNYRKGLMVPINTEVTFLKASGGAISVKLPDGATLKIENVEEFSGEKIEGIFERTFSKEPVDLSKYTAIEKQNIQQGSVDIGMSKDAVIKAIGYPPKHQTPSLDRDSWRYWKNRFGTFLVNFKDGKVESLKGI